MTRERAAELLSGVKVLDDTEMEEAHKMAISALRQQECVGDANKSLTLDEVTWKNCATCSPDSQEDCRKCWGEWTQSKNDPMTLDDLREMDGEPVWLVNQNGGHWVIMSGAYLWDKRKNAEYGKTWLAYRQKPEE